MCSVYLFSETLSNVCTASCTLRRSLPNIGQMTIYIIWILYFSVWYDLYHARAVSYRSHPANTNHVSKSCVVQIPPGKHQPCEQELCRTHPTRQTSTMWARAVSYRSHPVKHQPCEQELCHTDPTRQTSTMCTRRLLGYDSLEGAPAMFGGIMVDDNGWWAVYLTPKTAFCGKLCIRLTSPDEQTHGLRLYHSVPKYKER